MTMEGHGLGITCVIFAPDGRVGSVSADGLIRICDSATGFCLHTCHADSEESPAYPYTLAFGPLGELVVGSSTGLIKVYNATLDKLLYSFTPHAAAVSTIAVSEDGIIASGHEDGMVAVRKDKTIYTLLGHLSPVSSLAFLAAGYLVTAAKEGTVITWVAMGDGWKLSRPLEATPGLVLLTPDGTIICEEATGKLGLRDPLTSEMTTSLESHAFGIRNSHAITTVIAADRKLAACSDEDDCDIYVWDLASGICIYELTDHVEEIGSLSFAPGGRLLASGSLDGIVKIWDISMNSPLATSKGNGIPIAIINFTPNANRVVTESAICVMEMWSPKTGARLESQRRSDYSTSAKVGKFSRSGTRFASVCESPPMYNSVHVYDFSDDGRGDLLMSFPSKLPCCSASFSPNETHLALGYFDGRIKISDCVSGTCSATLIGHASQVCGVDFSQDGLQLASGSKDKTARIWDLKTEQSLRTFKGAVTCTQVCFMREPHLLCAGWENGEIRIFDASNGACLLDIQCPGAVNLLFLDPLGSLQTNFGLLCLEPAALDQAGPSNRACSYRLRGLGMSDDRAWILRDGSRILWLPPEYRPAKFFPSVSLEACHIDIHGCRLAVGCRSGHVVIFHDTFMGS